MRRASFVATAESMTVLLILPAGVNEAMKNSSAESYSPASSITASQFCPTFSPRKIRENLSFGSVPSIFAMYFVAGAGWANIVAAFSLLILGVGALAVAAPYRLARVLTFLGKSDDQSAAAYHINQALIAIGSGGVLGRGLGKSLQAYGYLPEATNDSIFAIIGEEAGLWGAGIIISVFALLFWRAIKIAKAAPDDFGKFLAFGIAFWIGFQSLINISAMLGLIPLTGIPLPFVSYGGTSLVALLAAIGILQNISKYTYKEVYDEDSSSRGRNSRSHIAGVGRHRVNTKA